MAEADNVFIAPEGLAASKEELLKMFREEQKPLSLKEVAEILGSTIKRDEVNKLITFLSMLLTYTEEDQINLGFLAESSTGKSYIPLELSWFFPSEDVLKLGYASPTSFFHDYGEMVEEPFTGRKLMHINLERKILIFLDQPHSDLLRRLRSLLSHDERQITLKITDKREKSGLRTKTVIIKGFPTVIFCTANFQLDDQEKTRLLLLSPEVSQEKLREAIFLKIQKDSDREEFKRRVLEDPKRKILFSRVYAIKRANVKHVKIPEELQAIIYKRFLSDHKVLLPRHQRDIGRLLALIKAHALLNYMHREQVRNPDGSLTIIANMEDFTEGYRLYREIAEANELGLSPELYSIYTAVKPNIPEEGLTVADFQKQYYKAFHKPISTKRAREILEILTSIGLLAEDVDPQDRRKKRYKLMEINTPEEWGKMEEAYPTPEEYLSGFLEAEKNTPQGWGKPGSQQESESCLQKNTPGGWGKLEASGDEKNTPQGWGEQEAKELEINTPLGWGKQGEEPPSIDGKTVVFLAKVSGSMLPLEKCHICQAQPVGFQANLTDGSWVLLCEKHGLEMLRRLDKQGRE